jgi:Kef-type K+ transport system membrane component KefB
VPFVLGLVPRVRIPLAAAELVVGVVVGPSVLGWVHLDQPVRLMSVLGVAFLLFIAGMALDLHKLEGAPLVLGSVGFMVSVGIAYGFELAFRSSGLVSSPFLVATALAATSLGIVVPVLKDTGYLDSPTGRFTVAGGTVAEFGTIVLLGVFFSEARTTPLRESGLLLVVAAVSVALLWGLARFSRYETTRRIFRLQADTSSQVRVRLAVLILLGSAVLAATFGFQAILGTFIAGAVFAIVIRGWDDEQGLRRKLDAIGFGFFIPVFFVASGMRIDLSSLSDWRGLVRVAVLAVVLLLVRGVPALLYRRRLGAHEMAAAGLLQATNISFIVVATDVGQKLNVITPAGATALIVAGLVSAVLFPLLAGRLLEVQGDGAGVSRPVNVGEGATAER